MFSTTTQSKTHKVFFVYALILVNVVAYVYTTYLVTHPLEYALIPFYAAERPWTLVTSGFMHAGLIHLLINMLVLWQIGKGIEERFGAIKFLGIYFTALLASSASVYLLSPEMIPTIGASGAVFGLIGFLVFLVSKEMMPSLIVFLALNMFVTFTVPNISWQGHLGGFLAGLAISGGVYLTASRVQEDKSLSNR